MHTRALDTISRQYGKKIDDELAEYNHKVGGGASNRLKDIVLAAHDGRVLTLLVSDSLETTGSFDEATHTVKGRETGTIRRRGPRQRCRGANHSARGSSFFVPNSKMPNGAPLSAIFRF